MKCEYYGRRFCTVYDGVTVQGLLWCHLSRLLSLVFRQKGCRVFCVGERILGLLMVGL